MTGYAVIDFETSKKRSFRFHLKSVTHRFTEMRFRMPRDWQAFEIDAKHVLQKNLERGSFDFWVEEALATSVDRESSARALFDKLARAVKQADGFTQFSLPVPFRALILSRYPEFWLSGEKALETTAIEKDEFLAAMASLTEKLDEVRRNEGSQVHKALALICAELKTRRDEIAQNFPKLRKDWEEQYRERLNKVAEEIKVSNPSEERILQEMLVLAEKRDVAEELQRILGHLETLENVLDSPPENVGKRLEFLLQELHREWTTLGNKIQNTSVSKHIVEAKLALEKIREQSLNLV